MRLSCICSSLLLQSEAEVLMGIDLVHAPELGLQLPVSVHLVHLAAQDLAHVFVGACRGVIASVATVLL